MKPSPSKPLQGTCTDAEKKDSKNIFSTSAEARKMALDPRALTLLLLLCAAFASVRGVANLDFDCSKPDPSPLNFNLFMELLSNHTDIAHSLKPAPVFADMDPEIPAYDITGRGFHLTDGRMSKDIARALCSNNEITFYFSMYLREIHSSGTVLEISSGQGARLPVFGVYFNAGADEIMFTYRHRGVPRTVSVDIRLHPGKWRNYAFVLSGHLLEFYFDCTVMFSEVVVLPDFCVDESSLVVTFADDSDRLNVEHSNGVHGYFQNVGFYLGRGGLAQQCPSVQKECPTCGQFLQLVERAFNLEKENERLKVEIEAQASVPQRRLGMPQNCNEGDVHVANGEFNITDNGICFCQDGNLVCNTEIQCQEMVPTTDPTTPVACDPLCTLDHQECVVGVCQCEDGFSFIDEQCIESDDTCEVSELPEGQRILRVSEQGFLYQDEENGRMDSCRVFTCMLEGFDEPLALSKRYGCTQNYTRANCSKELDTFQQNIAVCCQICTPCDFVTCGSHAHCQMSTATCACDDYYERNDEQECVDIDECSSDDGDSMCFANSKCVNEDPLYSCMCLEGYEMSVLDCQDKNECEAANSPCPENSNCTNTEGSYECNCFDGYEMSEDRSTCAPVCEQPCQNGGTCVSPATCICHPGYTGAQCADDINECTTGTHVCVHEASECINTIGGHFCRCRAGFRGNGTYCEDVNECESEIYQCERRGSICRNTHGSYLCDCNSVDCTGACRRKQAEYPNGMSFIDERNPCMNCTCSNGELVCRQRLCDCSSGGETRQCCPECFPSRDCHLESGGQMVSIRPNSIWADPKNPCIRWHCSSNLQLNIEDMSSLCPTLSCPEMFREPQPGRCCPVCLLPSCDGRNEGVTLPLYNGCKSCTCRGGDWNCKDVVTCSQSTDCSPQTILFYDQQCCPVCDSTLLGSSPTCRTLNPDL